ncbi:MAG: hypothetical protein WA432_02140 [Candidatus Babeliaceae bacterium]
MNKKHALMIIFLSKSMLYAMQDSDSISIETFDGLMREKRSVLEQIPFWANLLQSKPDETFFTYSPGTVSSLRMIFRLQQDLSEQAVASTSKEQKSDKETKRQYIASAFPEALVLADQWTISPLLIKRLAKGCSQLINDGRAGDKHRKMIAELPLHLNIMVLKELQLKSGNEISYLNMLNQHLGQPGINKCTKYFIWCLGHNKYISKNKLLCDSLKNNAYIKNYLEHVILSPFKLKLGKTRSVYTKEQGFDPLNYYIIEIVYEDEKVNVCWIPKEQIAHEENYKNYKILSKPDGTMLIANVENNEQQDLRDICALGIHTWCRYKKYLFLSLFDKSIRVWNIKKAAAIYHLDVDDIYSISLNKNVVKGCSPKVIKEWNIENESVKKLQKLLTVNDSDKCILS